MRTSMKKIRNAKYQIGQIVRHRLYPFRGVVFDIDPVFDNTEEWYEAIPAEVAFAKKIIAAMPDGSGAVMIDGKMQDDATWKQAKVLVDLARLVAGTDQPAGSGVQPLGMLRVMASAASLGGIDGATAVAIATGNVAKLHDDANGVVAPGREADLLVVDSPLGSQASSALEALEIGDTLAVAFAIIDGKIAVTKSRNTPPPARKIALVGADPSQAKGH